MVLIASGFYGFLNCEDYGDKIKWVINVPDFGMRHFLWTRSKEINSQEVIETLKDACKADMELYYGKNTLGNL